MSGNRTPDEVGKPYTYPVGSVIFCAFAFLFSRWGDGSI